MAALRPETPAPLEPASGSRTETVKCELCGGENCLLAFCSSDKCIRNAVVAQWESEGWALPQLSSPTSRSACARCGPSCCAGGTLSYASRFVRRGGVVLMVIPPPRTRARLRRQHTKLGEKMGGVVLL